MAKNSNFHFKQFSINQQMCAMKVSTDACLFGAQTTVDNQQRILDIGAGTGLLALMAAQRSQAVIEAVELDAQAALQAGDNFQNSPWSSRLTIHHSSIQDFADQHNHRFDLIICNPPFFTNHTISANTLRHQARHNDSLSFPDLADAACTLLSDNGCMEVLLPTSEYGRFIAIAEAKGLIVFHITHIQPTPNKAIHREIIKLRKQQNRLSSPPAQESLMVIKDAVGNYSRPFRELLAPYYLKL